MSPEDVELDLIFIGVVPSSGGGAETREERASEFDDINLPQVPRPPPNNTRLIARSITQAGDLPMEVCIQKHT